MRFQGRNLRKGRVSEPGRIYLLTTVTRDRAPLFAQWPAACLVAREIHAMAGRTGISTLAWVLMPDHLHWLVKLESGELGRYVQRLKSRTAIALNWLNNHTGAVWQRGYHDHAVRNEADVKSMARYIVANPLRAGLVKNIGDYSLWDVTWLSRA
ncbi:transposase [Pseudomonas boanensis]|uniref:REP-associated tyrosine transposase n=1 Tax=Metapseudomonas boanensis TaxID=2822138 RepID=UPI0035D46FBD